MSEGNRVAVEERLTALGANTIWNEIAKMERKDLANTVVALSETLTNPLMIRALLAETEGIADGSLRGQLQEALAVALGRYEQAPGSEAWGAKSNRNARLAVTRGVASGIAQERGLVASRTWVSNLPQDLQYNSIGAALSVGVARGETAQALAWLKSPELQQRDMYIVKLVPELLDRDPQRALEAARLVSNEQDRSRLVALAIETLRKSDPRTGGLQATK